MTTRTCRPAHSCKRRMIFGATFAAPFGDALLGRFHRKAVCASDFPCTGLPATRRAGARRPARSTSECTTRPIRILSSPSARSFAMSGRSCQIQDAPQADALPGRFEFGVATMPRFKDLSPDVHLRAAVDVVARLADNQGARLPVGRRGVLSEPLSGPRRLRGKRSHRLRSFVRRRYRDRATADRSRAIPQRDRCPGRRASDVPHDAVSVLMRGAVIAVLLALPVARGTAQRVEEVRAGVAPRRHCRAKAPRPDRLGDRSRDGPDHARQQPLDRLSGGRGPRVVAVPKARAANARRRRPRSRNCRAASRGRISRRMAATATGRTMR